MKSLQFYNQLKNNQCGPTGLTLLTPYYDFTYLRSVFFFSLVVLDLSSNPYINSQSHLNNLNSHPNSFTLLNISTHFKITITMGYNLEYFELNTGAKIPSIGLGTYATPPEIVIAAVKLGYRHIDCAHVYQNEKQIGQVLKQLFEEGVVKREELFITSKLWNYDHEPEDVPKAIDRTLADLQLDYLDLYLIHWPVKEKKGAVSNAYEKLLMPDIPGTWKAMEALYDSGKVRAVGVSNFSTKKLQDLLEVARVPPAVNQVECHPMWQQEKLHKFCESKGVHLTGYSPLGSQAPGSKKDGGLLEDPVLSLVAGKLGKSPAQVALRWGIQMGHSVLPKTSSEARLKQNMDLFDWTIPEDLITKFSEIEQVKFVKPTSLVHEKSAGYKTLEEMWDGEL